MLADHNWDSNEWANPPSSEEGIALGGRGKGTNTVVFGDGGNRKDQSLVYSWHPEGTHVVHQTCCIIHGRLCAAPCLPKQSRLFLREEWKEAGRVLLSRNGVGRQHRGTVIRDTHSPNRHTPLSCAFLLNFLWLSHNSLLLEILIYSLVCFLALCDTRKKIQKIIDKLDKYWSGIAARIEINKYFWLLESHKEKLLKELSRSFLKCILLQMKSCENLTRYPGICFLRPC